MPDKNMSICIIRAEREKDYTFNLYDHGGSRIFIDGEAGDRQILVDTYYDEQFANYIDGCVRRYFGFTVMRELVKPVQ